MAIIPAWDEIERDMKLAMLLVADGMMNLLGGGPRAISAAETFLDIKLPEGFRGFIVSEANEEHSEDADIFLASIRLEGTNLFRAVTRARNLLLDLKPIHRVSYDDERDEAIYWLEYFVSAIPTDSYGSDGDYSQIVYDASRPLPLLRDLGYAYTSLIEFVQSTTHAHHTWDDDPAYQTNRIVFAAQDVALLGGVDLRSVRNAMGPKEGKPIRSFRTSASDKDESSAYADPVDAIEWLAGRRGFRTGALDAGWVNSQLEHTGSRKAIGSLAGMMFWLNGRTSADFEGALGWSPRQVRDWTRGLLDAGQARAVAAAAGLDQELYARRVEDLLGNK